MFSVFGIKSFAQDNNPESLKVELTAKAEADDPCSMFDLGTLYLMHPKLSGSGAEEVYKWYTEAAEKGHAQAQENLCEMYFYGVGKEKDLNEAMKWCSSATLDANVTEDDIAQIKRMGALWKSDLLAATHPETKKFVYMTEWEYQGKIDERPGKIGGMVGHPSTWNCKSVFEINHASEMLKELQDRTGQ